MIPLTKAVLLLQLVLDIIAGNKTDAVAVAKELMALALDMIPVDQLKEFLSDQDRKFADLATDVAEEIKLSEPKP